MTSGVAVDGLSFSYGGRRSAATTIVDVTLRADPGEILAVVGPSGSGKSTLLRLVSGLLHPQDGTVHLGGRDVTALPPEERPVAMLFQGYALFPHLDVAANIGFGLAVRKVSKQSRQQQVGQIAERLGLGHLLARRPGELSGGEQQRVALARSLLRSPVAFCLDEPLSSLDPVLRTKARRDLEDLLRADDRCALYVTHDQHEAMTLGDRVALLRAGRVEQVGTPRELYDNPATTFVATFIGTPPMSLLPAGTAGLPAPEGVATLGLRAEHVHLVAGDAGEVVAIDDLGHEQLAELMIDGHLVVARLEPGSTVRRGDRTGITLSDYRGFDAAGRATA